jgi:hypothetical protein
VPKRHPEVITAEAFNLVDDKGEIRARLYADGPSGITCLHFYDSSGNPSIDIQVSKKGEANIGIKHSNGVNYAVSMGTDSDGSAGLSIGRTDGRIGVTLGVRTGENGAVIVCDAEGQPAAKLEPKRPSRRRNR